MTMEEYHWKYLRFLHHPGQKRLGLWEENQGPVSLYFRAKNVESKIRESIKEKLGQEQHASPVDLAVKTYRRKTGIEMREKTSYAGERKLAKN